MRQRFFAPVLLCLVGLVTALGPLAAEQGLPAAREPWTGPDGEPLPFTSPEQMAQMLASARQVSSKDLSVGITKPRKLGLDAGGVRFDAVFHHVDRKEDNKVKRLQSGRTVNFFRDSFRGQIAAYRVSRLLGMDMVPPTARRVSDRQDGSAQLWIEGAMTDLKRREEKIEVPDSLLWNRQSADMWVFDNLINNIDRNQGNMLLDGKGNLWLIDHSRSFGRDTSLGYEKYLTRCSWTLWQGLLALDEVRVLEELRDLATKPEVKALFKRRQKLIAWFEERVAERGEERVFFHYDQPEKNLVSVRISSPEPPASSSVQ